MCTDVVLVNPSMTVPFWMQVELMLFVFVASVAVKFAPTPFAGSVMVTVDDALVVFSPLMLRACVDSIQSLPLPLFVVEGRSESVTVIAAGVAVMNDAAAIPSLAVPPVTEWLTELTFIGAPPLAETTAQLTSFEAGLQEQFW